MPKTVGECMVKGPYIVTPDEPIMDTLEMMSDLHVRHLPVVKGVELIGIVSERNLKAASSLNQATLLTVGDVMQPDVYAVPQTTPLQVVVRDMAQTRIGCAVIVDANQEIVGIFTTTDALFLLADLLNGDSPEFEDDDEYLAFDEDSDEADFATH